MAIFREKISRKQVNFSALIENRDKIILLFPENVEDQYFLLRICAGWQGYFKKFIFIMPDEVAGYYSNLANFKAIQIQNYNDENINFNNALIFDFSGNKLQKQNILAAHNSVIASPDNIGNIHFVPAITDPKELLSKLCEFFAIPINNKELTYDFTNEDMTLHNNEFYSNKFLNFTINVDNSFPNEKIKELIIQIKQNFPANCYLVGKELKKHEFINFRNLTVNSLLDLYKIARNSDIFLNTSEYSAKLFSATEIKQIYIGRIPLEERMIYINPVNLTNLKNKISSILEKE